MTEDKAMDVCKVGQGPACCKYVTMDADGWKCLKLTSMKAAVDARTNMKSKGDNCDGEVNK